MKRRFQRVKIEIVNCILSVFIFIVHIVVGNYFLRTPDTTFIDFMNTVLYKILLVVAYPLLFISIIRLLFGKLIFNGKYIIFMNRFFVNIIFYKNIKSIGIANEYLIIETKRGKSRKVFFKFYRNKNEIIKVVNEAKPLFG